MSGIDKDAVKNLAKKHLETRQGQKRDDLGLTVYDRTTIRRFLLSPTEISNTEADQFNRSSSLLSFFRGPDEVSRGLYYLSRIPILFYRESERTPGSAVFYCLTSKVVEPGGKYQKDTILADILSFIREIESGSQFRSKLVRVPSDTIDIMLAGMKDEVARKKTVTALVPASATSEIKTDEDLFKAFVKGTHSWDILHPTVVGKYSIRKGVKRWNLYKGDELLAVRVYPAMYVNINSTHREIQLLNILVKTSDQIVFYPASVLKTLDETPHSSNAQTATWKNRDGEKKDLDFEPVPDKTGIHWYETSTELLDLLAANVPGGYHAAHGSGHVYWIPDDWEGGIAICAHTDTVWDKKVEVAVKSDGSAVSAVHGRGIGADDRSGVLVSEEAAKLYPGKFVHMFFDGEERGCTGSNAAPVGFEVDFFLSLDRRGNNQVALYGYDNLEVRKAFEDAGGTLAQGSNTDCAVLARRFGKCCANLSVGFNDEHHAGESYDPSGVAYALGILGKLEKRQFRGQVPEKHNTFWAGWSPKKAWTDDWFDYDLYRKKASSKSATKSNAEAPKITRVPAKLTKDEWKSFEDWDDHPTSKTPVYLSWEDEEADQEDDLDIADQSWLDIEEGDWEEEE